MAGRPRVAAVAANGAGAGRQRRRCAAQGLEALRELQSGPARDKAPYEAVSLAHIDECLTPEAAAERMAVSRATFYRLLKRGVSDLATELSRPATR